MVNSTKELICRRARGRSGGSSTESKDYSTEGTLWERRVLYETISNCDSAECARGWELELLACRRNRGQSSRLRLWLNGNLQVQCAAIEVRRLELEIGMDDKRKQREQQRLNDI